MDIDLAGQADRRARPGSRCSARASRTTRSASSRPAPTTGRRRRGRRGRPRTRVVELAWAGRATPAAAAAAAACSKRYCSSARPVRPYATRRGRAGGRADPGVDDQGVHAPSGRRPLDPAQAADHRRPGHAAGGDEQRLIGHDHQPPAGRRCTDVGPDLPRQGVQRSSDLADRRAEADQRPRRQGGRAGSSSDWLNEQRAGPARRRPRPRPVRVRQLRAGTTSRTSRPTAGRSCSTSSRSTSSTDRRERLAAAARPVVAAWPRPAGRGDPGRSASRRTAKAPAEDDDARTGRVAVPAVAGRAADATASRGRRCTAR